MANTTNTDYLNVLQKLKRKEGLFRILIFTLVTILCWIGFGIFLSQRTTKVPTDIRQMTNPLNPNIERQAFQEINNRKTFTEQELESFPIYRIEVDLDGNRNIVSSTGETISVLSDSSDNIIASESASELESEQATESAEIQ